MALHHEPVTSLPPERFREVLTADGLAEFERTIARGRELLRSRTFWTVNSTARGGGVAEMLRSLIGYVRGAAVDARWIVIEGDEEFFRVTKRLHNRLHGYAGDGGPLGDAEQAAYERCAAGNATQLLELVKADDVVLLHDPQTAGLVPHVAEAGVPVIWRAHVGLDLPNDLARDAWRFLTPYVERADAYVFSRGSFVWESLDRNKVTLIPPSIDAPRRRTTRCRSRASPRCCGPPVSRRMIIITPARSSNGSTRASEQSSAGLASSRKSRSGSTRRWSRRSRGGIVSRIRSGCCTGSPSTSTPATSRTWSSRARTSRRSPTTRRAPTCSRRPRPHGGICRCRFAAACTWRCCRWPMPTRTR